MAGLIPSFKEDFTYLEEYGLLVCASCAIAVLPNRLYKHSSSQHYKPTEYCIAIAE
jgi:hypothetical protein